MLKCVCPVVPDNVIANVSCHETGFYDPRSESLIPHDVNDTATTTTTATTAAGDDVTVTTPTNSDSRQHDDDDDDDGATTISLIVSTVLAIVIVVIVAVWLRKRVLQRRHNARQLHVYASPVLDNTTSSPATDEPTNYTALEQTATSQQQQHQHLAVDQASPAYVNDDVSARHQRYSTSCQYEDVDVVMSTTASDGQTDANDEAINDGYEVSQ